MASIRKRGSSWHVQVRRSGQPSLTRSFNKKPDAIAWGRQTEAEIDRRGLAPSRADLERFTVGDLLKRYRDEVVVHKRGKRTETYTIEALLRHRLSGYALGHVTPNVFRLYRDERMNVVKGATVCRDLCILQHAFTIAIKEWGLPLFENPLAAVSRPSLGPHRERRLRDGEFEKLLKGCLKGRVWWLSPLIRLAIETGMRRGELLNIQRHHINHDQKTLYIPVTKNGHSRTIPLTGRAMTILNEAPHEGDRLFPLSGNAVRLAWERLKRRMDIEDLRFHDLRHEAISRFFEMNLSVPEVALISGHRDYRMLSRYTHLKAQDVAKKIGILVL